jgi:thiol-disulfide isomerase/thioredoxin
MKLPRATIACVLLFAVTGCYPGGDASPAVNELREADPQADSITPTTDAPPVLDVPAYEVVGERIDTLLPSRWLYERRAISGEGAAKATLVRFWTDTCPFCARSLPQIEELRDRLGPEGFEAIGVYHPKPPRTVTDEDVVAAAARLGFTGPVAVDDDWSSLRSIWLTPPNEGRRATSASFLVDAQGVVRFVHPGPEFVGDDLEEIERAIRALLDAD